MWAVIPNRIWQYYFLQCSLHSTSTVCTLDVSLFCGGYGGPQIHGPREAAILKSKSFTVHPPWIQKLCRGADLANWGTKPTTGQVKDNKTPQINKAPCMLFFRACQARRSGCASEIKVVKGCVYSPRIWCCGCPCVSLCREGGIEAEWY